MFHLSAQAGACFRFAGWASCGLVGCSSTTAREVSSAANAAAESPSERAAASSAMPEALRRAPSSSRAPAGALPITAAREALDEARRAVLLLGRSAWTETREKSAQALASLARLLEAADRRGSAAREISGLRSQSEHLRGAGIEDFAHVDAIATGLSSALAGIEALQLDHPRALALWLDAAREAIAGLQQGATTPALRAPTIQDAFRATFDAIQAALQLAGTDPGSAPGVRCGQKMQGSSL